MHHAWQLRSAWAWRCTQRKAKRSLGAVGPPGTAIGVGGEEARDGGLMLALVLNPGVIVGGAQAAASVATGGNGGAGRAAARPFRWSRGRRAWTVDRPASGPAAAPCGSCRSKRWSAARRAAARTMA